MLFTTSVGLIPLLLIIIASGGLAMAGASDITAQETDLNPAGEVYEMNPDAAGNLWISDYGANQIWRVDPTTDAYTIYEDMTSAADARMDVSGDVWWTDVDNNDLGRISLSANEVTIWSLGAEGYPQGLAFDDAGHVWVADWYYPNLHRFDPASGELCTCTLPLAGSSFYILARGGHVWLGDWYNGRILKFDPSSDQLTWWEIAGLNALPMGLAFDASNNLWWADMGLDAIARLEPTIDLQTTYTLPVGSDAKMIAIANDGLVWYTESVSGTVGSLNPAQAGGVSSTLAKTTIAVALSCSDLGAGTTSSIDTQSGTATWLDADLTTLVEGGGWRVYQLPTNGSPYGVASSVNSTFVVDQGRQKLLKIPHKYTIYQPVVLKNWSP